jgi:ElaB/YqjD/DUF883 family membrane-anchored ribosome-binding protein
MAPNDADMPDHFALSEDLKEIAKHIATLRQDIDGLTGAIGRTGAHQADQLQAQANEALGAVQDAVRRDPLTSLGIALGVGFLLGVLMRR